MSISPISSPPVLPPPSIKIPSPVDQYQHIPSELRSLDRWLLWTETPEHKKTPRSVHTGALANGPDACGTFEQALEARERYGTTGIGFLPLPQDEIVVIDLDHCLDANGNLAPAAAEIVRQLASYAERSPGGDGLHLWIRGVLPFTGRRRAAIQWKMPDGSSQAGQIEVWSSSQYATVTGQRIEESGEFQANDAGLRWLLLSYFSGADSPAAPSPPVPVQVKIGEGGRNDHLTRELGSLLRHRPWPEDVVLAAARAITAAQHTPPLDDREVVATVQGALRRFQQTAEKQPEWQFQGDLIARAKVPDLAYVVEGLIVEGGITALVSPPSHGKSSVSTAIAYTVSQGLPFAGCMTSPRKALILDRDNNGPGVKYRCDVLGIPLTEEMQINTQDQEFPPPDIDSVGLHKWIEQTNPRPLLIIDTFAAYLSDNENDASAVTAFFTQLRRLAAMGVTVILLHHSGKSETARAFRGSSAIAASVDTLWRLESRSPDPSRRLDLIEWEPVKVRFGGHRFALRFNSASKTWTSEAELPGPIPGITFRELLERNPGVTVRGFQDLAAKNGLSRDKARTYLSQGVDRGEIRATPGNKGARRHTLTQDNFTFEEETECDPTSF